MSCCRSSAMDWRTHDADCKYAPDACDRYDDERRAQLADPSISPAQLRERVEALEKRVADNAAATVTALELVKFNLGNRLDAALRRIEQLEKQQARWSTQGVAEHIFNRIKHGDDEHQAWLKARAEVVAEEITRPSAPIDKEDV